MDNPAKENLEKRMKQQREGFLQIRSQAIERVCCNQNESELKGCSVE
jgi:hypothetical protein